MGPYPISEQSRNHRSVRIHCIHLFFALVGPDGYPVCSLTAIASDYFSFFEKTVVELVHLQSPNDLS
jgi:hypothetical protein